LIEVTVKDGEQIEHALRRFKKKWERAGVLRELRRKAFYIKPSVIKRVEREKTMRRVARLSRIYR
jgi:small subunit ribosomal protein S21